MVKTVKYALVHYYIDIVDPISGQTRKVERLATHGQKLSTDHAPMRWEDRDPSVKYDVPESEIRRMEAEHPGAFFSEYELRAMEAGVTDVSTPRSGFSQVLGDTHTTPGMAVPDPDHSPVTGAEAPHPLSFHELSVAQLAEYIRTNQVDVNELLEIAHASPDLSDKILQADTEAGGGEPRDELVMGISQVRGFSMPSAGGERPLDDLLQNAGGSPSTSEGEGGTEPPAEPDESEEKPAKSASRGEWDEYARSQGVDPEEYTSKEALIAAFEDE